MAEENEISKSPAQKTDGTDLARGDSQNGGRPNSRSDSGSLFGGARPYVSFVDLNRRTGGSDPSDPEVRAIEIGFRWTF